MTADTPRTNHWIEKTADQVEEHAARTKGDGARLVCASGISPSGPIHLGNLRELMTVHLVADELRRRGREVEHLHSWDDFDRLRKVPAGVPAGFAEHIGRPLADVPDPGGEFPSYAVRFMGQLREAAAQLGIEARWVRQSEAYRRGDYTAEIKTAMERRLEIFDILAEYQTEELQEKPREERRAEYYPYRVYSTATGKDTTRILDYDAATGTIAYRCEETGLEESFRLDEKMPGKLVWKVDWPMRWAHERVDFEPGGEDHSAPGSSYTVGRQLVRAIYDWQAPCYIGYAFVGMAGQTKMSSSLGTEGTPASALDIYEPAILRWLYLRRPASKAFSINFDDEVIRTYDEWDGMLRKRAEGKLGALEEFTVVRATSTSRAEVAHAEPLVNFRLLYSGADLTQGNRDQIYRIASDQLSEEGASAPSRGELEAAVGLRVVCAVNWATKYLPDEKRTQVRAAFAPEAWATLSEEQQASVRLLLDGLDTHWSFGGLTSYIYGIPKLRAGLPLDAPPTPELKVAQREFFIALYRLLVDSDTGPRLPTLFISLGRERIRALLTPQGSR